jgi:hypothetical protein
MFSTPNIKRCLFKKIYGGAQLNGLRSGFTFSFLKKISVTTGNGIPAEISRFSGNFDRKEFSNSKFRNFGIPAGFSVHLAGFSVLFTEK